MGSIQRRKLFRKTRLRFFPKVGAPTVRRQRPSSVRNTMRKRLYLSACWTCVFRLSDLSANRLDEREDGGAIQNYLLERDGQRTVPNIFIGRWRHFMSRLHGSNVLYIRSKAYWGWVHLPNFKLFVRWLCLGCDDVFTKHKKGEIAALLKWACAWYFWSSKPQGFFKRSHL